MPGLFLARWAYSQLNHCLYVRIYQVQHTSAELYQVRTYVLVRFCISIFPGAPAAATILLRSTSAYIINTLSLIHI